MGPQAWYNSMSWVICRLGPIPSELPADLLVSGFVLRVQLHLSQNGGIFCAVLIGDDAITSR